MSQQPNNRGGGRGGGGALIPLRRWIEDEARRQADAALSSSRQRIISATATGRHPPIDASTGLLRWRRRKRRESLLRKTTVAYGVASLMRRIRSHPGAYPSSLESPSLAAEGERCVVDQFAVRVLSRDDTNDVRGVEMTSLNLSVDIAEPSFLLGGYFDESGGDGDCDDDDDEQRAGDRMGRYLEAEFPPLPDGQEPAIVAEVIKRDEEDARCRSLGVVLYELFSHLPPPLMPMPPPPQSSDVVVLGGKLLSSPGGAAIDEGRRELSSPSSSSGPPRKRARPLSDPGASFDAVTPNYVPLSDLGLPPSLCLLVRNLLECGGRQGGDGDDGGDDDGDQRHDRSPENAYESLDAVVGDLHLLLLDPGRFLFNDRRRHHRRRDVASSSENNDDGSSSPPRLLFRKHKLYGREREVSEITEAFCRVSSGTSEAFFIAGFSGSGKSMLVNSLSAQVGMADGYVLMHKFDQMSKERPLSGVIATFNQLCLLIAERSSQQELLGMVKDLMEVFGTDFTALYRLLPDIKAISPQLRQTTGGDRRGGREETDDDQMNLRSVCFTLQRFMRVVSSKSHPVMLFLDDLQWCDESALALVRSLLLDTSGSSCLFFVGSYRHNEVVEDHAIFSLVDSLKSSGVPTTTLTLEGLSLDDLNTMMSDAMCVFPRICRSLSDVVFQKTKGNPFFVLEFLRSLVDGGLLEYNEMGGRWVWDVDSISSMDITGNVLYLLSSKMNGLSENVQLALKVAACLGTTIKESAVGYLSADSKFSGIRAGLEHAVGEGFMIRDRTSGFKFAHDKVREAAYGLIPNSEKSQYHFKLGMSLYSMVATGSNEDGIISSIADQINHGVKDSLAKSPELRIDIAKLNGMAGAEAVDHFDFVTARSYLNTALSLLPADHWKSQYDQSLQLSFLLAKSAYSCGDVEKAQRILREVLVECRCIEDKLPSYHLLVTILYAGGEGMDAYATCQEVLTQLGETIPQTFDPAEINNVLNSTSKMVQSTSDTNLLEMALMEEKLSISLKFYSLMGVVSFFVKPNMLPFFACRMVQQTLKHGVCKYSIMGFVQYASILCRSKAGRDIETASRLGKAAMFSLKKRFNSADLLPKLIHVYFGIVAVNTEPLQSCAHMLEQGFNSGMSSGESGTAFLNAIQYIKTSLFAGEKLPTLLKKADYYLELAEQYKNELAKMYLSIFRDTISILIDKGESTGSKGNPSNTTTANHSETMNFHRAIQAYWQGHSERCHHYVGKMLSSTKSVTGTLRLKVVTFYYGLNSCRVLKRQNTAKLRAIPKNAITTLKAAMGHSRWNFRNKVHLLEAESFSFHGNHEEAKASYAAAITSARCSRFIHEQGLACELAGFHYKKIGDHRTAWSFFNQAKQCYSEWGSQFKVESMTRELETFQVSLVATANH